jgi:hypothetical protein
MLVLSALYTIPVNCTSGASFFWANADKEVSKNNIPINFLITFLTQITCHVHLANKR